MTAKILDTPLADIMQLLIDYPPPLWLAHQPVALFPYAPFDGLYAGETDCMYLSVGRAQYDENDLSVKTFRHSEKRWSRQSEELPPHRAVDLVIWLTLVLFSRSGGKIHVPKSTFWKQDHDITINCPPDEEFSDRLVVLDDFLKDDPENPDSPRRIIENRLNSLANLLKELGFPKPAA